MTWLLKGGRVVDPVAGIHDTLDVLLADGVVRAVGQNLPSGGRELDCRGKYVVPGFIDLGARTGEPGREHRETVATASRAAAAGGFTALCALPDGDPVADGPEDVRFLLEQARREAIVRVYPAAELTVGGRGAMLTEIGALRDAGAVALTAMTPVPDAGGLRRGLQYAGMFRLPVLLRGADPGLAGRGVMHEGAAATVQGLAGIPAAAEDLATARHLIVAEAVGVAVHIAALSSAGSVELVRRAKERGLPVTASVSGQQLTFIDEDVDASDANWKTDPPFRSRKDRDALRAAVAEGVIDAVFSDHGPLSREEKDVEFAEAPFGMTSLETVAALTWSELVAEGIMSVERFVDGLSAAPARILGVPGGTLRAGTPADVAVIDPEQRWTYDETRSFSLSRNTPVRGKTMTGRVVATFVGGALVMKDGGIVKE